MFYFLYTEDTCLQIFFFGKIFADAHKRTTNTYANDNGCTQQQSRRIFFLLALNRFSSVYVLNETIRTDRTNRLIQLFLFEEGEISDLRYNIKLLARDK